MSNDDTSTVEDAEIDALIDWGRTLIDKIFQERPLDEVKKLIYQDTPLWCQDDDGNSALHAAAYAENGELVDLLIERGAIWNAVDNLGNTAGDIALSLNNEGCYRSIRDAGLRSEYLLSHLSSKKSQLDPSSSVIIRTNDTTAAGSSTEFLTSPLKFTKDANGQDVCLVRVGDEEVGVMMGWEKSIMQETVNKLCEGLNDDFSVLNIGFGLGIIDSMFQDLPVPPKQHFIIEAHPDVLEHMRKLGWYEKPGVTILEGKWQDFVESEELLATGGFDIVYTDTFSEDYQDLHKFFEHLPDLMSGPQARFSFFNGLGATNALFYDVYTQLSELHLSNVGVDVTWSDVDVIGGLVDADKWSGTRNYFGMRFYRMPIGRMSLM
ncbi:S-adenosyl-L-methionine-dependent methyltransferase [Phellopilus nigrolimitatus]|nr:S-adenosyl-L-methionine-dependent methyltransferase [Phellopilus nigrolimitatus]